MTNNIEKYGTTYFPTFKGKLLNTPNLKRMSEEEKEEVAEFSFQFFRENGFPYPEISSEELIRSFDALACADVNLIENNKVFRIDNQAGAKVFKHFSPHFYEVKNGIAMQRPSMLEAFNNDDLLRRTIKNRLRFNYHINGNMLRQGLCNSKLAFKASIFNCVLAKAVYTKFTKDNDIIYDYSMGFGQRLLGAMSLPHRVKYVGVDVLEKSVLANQDIYNFLNWAYILNKEVDIVLNGSENFCDEKYHGKVNLAFSSPPYFNLESYSNDETQAYYENNYDHFINVWWDSTVKNIEKMLTSDGLFLLNMKNIVGHYDLIDHMSYIIKKHGFELADTYYIKLTKNVKFQNSRGEHKLEPILIFKRK
jgi:tRNA1(Val) A37 N6-methylase TrmN6